MSESEKNPTLLAEALAAILKPIVKEALREAISDNAQGARKYAGATGPFLTVREAADLARLGASTIRLYIRKRKLRAYKEGRRVIVKRTDLEKFLEAHPIETLTD